MTGNKPIFTWCTTEIDNCSFSRRCFMTGEYCSKQQNVQSERKKLHAKREIHAFVVMNFSNMSDVVYRWRLKSFVETLSKHLFFNNDKTRLYCVDGEDPTDDVLNSIIISESNDEIRKDSAELDAKRDLLKKLLSNRLEEGEQSVLIPVEKINVVRADSNPSSNFVICNRVCQQMQIADLIVVDVSVQNVNVFYELGMAVALGKMILPICYSESYFSIKLPLEKDEWKKLTDNARAEHHIDCFPWRRNLFEHFGMRFRDAYRTAQWYTTYEDFGFVTSPQYNYSDIKYIRFPYQETIDSDGKEMKIGQIIYDKLHDSYNEATYDENTLVIYTMDSILNATQAARCIVNYYHAIVRPFIEQPCFCGERVGILLQTNTIPEDPKDGPKDSLLLYSVGEIIQIGMNQATYKANMDMIKPDNYLDLDHIILDETGSERKVCAETRNHTNMPTRYPTKKDRWHEKAIAFTKDFVQNRCIPVYPTDPVYVKRIKDGLQKDIFDPIELKSTNFPADPEQKEKAKRFFFLYHIMLRTLQFTNEIVVDISTNSVQALFWLGAAHGSDTNAITVRRDETSAERLTLTGAVEKKERNIFDVAGLWTAVYRSNDTGGFYDQLAKAQAGIEQHSKLTLQNRAYYDENLGYAFWHSSSGTAKADIERLRIEKEDQEDIVLESYLRNRFWRPMLKYNRLRIYLEQKDEIDAYQETRPNVLKWDVDAVACLNNYLSKRKAIGEYQVTTLKKNEFDESASNVNYICVGSEIIVDQQTGKLFLDYINELDGLSSKTRRRRNADTIFIPKYSDDPKRDCHKMLKGFESTDTGMKWLTQLPMVKCAQCLSNWKVKKTIPVSREIIHDYKQIIQGDTTSDCLLKCNYSNLDKRPAGLNSRYHVQLAQLILWREHTENDSKAFDSSKNGNYDKYRVIITGASGPATRALVSIFVDETLKQYDLPVLKSENLSEQIPTPGDFHEEDTYIRRFPLLNMQEKIREEVVKEFFIAIDRFSEAITKEKHEMLNECREDQINGYFRLVKKSSYLYLSTVLYRYFLPFLSTEDIQRIYNGMQMYVSSLRSSNISPYAKHYIAGLDDDYSTTIPGPIVAEVASAVPLLLKTTLQALRGVEAFFEVEVKLDVFHEEETKHDEKEAMGRNNPVDSRQIIGIKQLPGEDGVKSLFLFPNKQEYQEGLK